MSFTADELRAKVTRQLEKWERERAEEEAALELERHQRTREYLDKYLPQKTAAAVKNGVDSFFLEPPIECKSRVIAELASLGLTAAAPPGTHTGSINVSGVTAWYAAGRSTQ